MLLTTYGMVLHNAAQLRAGLGSDVARGEGESACLPHCVPARGAPTAPSRHRARASAARRGRGAGRRRPAVPRAAARAAHPVGLHRAGRGPQGARPRPRRARAASLAPALGRARQLPRVRTTGAPAQPKPPRAPRAARARRPQIKNARTKLAERLREIRARVRVIISGARRSALRCCHLRRGRRPSAAARRARRPAPRALLRAPPQARPCRTTWASCIPSWSLRCRGCWAARGSSRPSLKSPSMRARTGRRGAAVGRRAAAARSSCAAAARAPRRARHAAAALRPPQVCHHARA